MKFYNTLTKQKEVFEPLFPGKVGMYACGPTVYDYIHIGNLRAYVFSDTIRRVLEHEGYEVRLIRNITDVGHMTGDDIAQGDTGEDKMERKAKAERRTPAEIAAFYEEYFHDSEKRMNLLPAHYYPRATAHVPQMIRMIEALIARGHAYESNGNVFFDVTSFPDYGRLSGNTLENLKTGARLEEHPDKRNPWDFALWLKAPKDHIMRWSSPWSEGYPGWHIECSAMSQEYLGDTFDIHSGGEDNIFPHHEAEIAQSECASGKPFARYWLHNRHLLIDGAKMSKSKGNFLVLEDIVEKGFSPMDLRLLYLSSHYRSQMNFTWDSLASAKKNRQTLAIVAGRLKESAPGTEDFSSEASAKFFAALDDDMNTPQALSELLGFANRLNGALDAGTPVDTMKAAVFMEEAYSVFGMTADTEAEVPPEIRRLADERETARNGKDFPASDALRDRILSAGWIVEDTPKGPSLRKK